MDTPIRLGTRIVGHLGADKIYRKQIYGSKHFLRQPRAITFDVPIVEQLERLGCESVAILDMETNKPYCAALQTIRERGFHVSRGLGPQIGLLLTEFNRAQQVPTDDVSELVSRSTEIPSGTVKYQRAKEPRTIRRWWD